MEPWAAEGRAEETEQEGGGAFRCNQSTLPSFYVLSFQGLFYQRVGGNKERLNNSVFQIAFLLGHFLFQIICERNYSMTYLHSPMT